MTNAKIFEKALCKIKGYPYGCIIFPEVLKEKRYYSTIFDIGFAKAFWGDKRVDKEGNGVLWTKGSIEGYLFVYEYHLQQMVKKEEPLKYLEKFL